jgi:hypothetical protein
VTPVEKFVGSAPVVVKATGVPAVVGRPVPAIVEELLVNVTVKVEDDPASAV